MVQPSLSGRNEWSGKTATTLAAARDLVVLIPGFLGFGRLGGFAYFADHIEASLRTALEVSHGRRTPVVTVSTLPAGSLVDRQRILIQQLARWQSLYKPERMHLVTHSSGGVDAYFLTATTTLSRTAWTPEQDYTRKRIASIVTMAAPFLGTCLSDSEAGRFFGGATRMPPPLRELASIASGAFHLLWENSDRLQRTAELATGLPAAAGFVRQLACHRELIAELSPKRMAERYEKLERELFPRLSCYVSYVHPPDREHASSLFLKLHRYTAEGSDKPAGREHMAINRQLLERARVIAAPGVRAVTLDPSSNDGVVNTLRQLPPGIREQDIAGLVLADHADLLGYYDRYDPIAEREYQVSVFRSGATFRDDQFFELFGDVARRLGPGLTV